MAVRVLKFRAWDSKNRVMLYPDLYWFEGEGIHEIPGDVPDWYKIMQFTGLLDKNGKEIYEGDIVRHNDWDLLWIVKWCDGKGENLGNHVGWWLDNGYYKQEFVAFLQGDEIGKREEYVNATILGNIHEHPDLLKDMGSFGYDPLTGEQA